jgi:hypothetical protein
MKTIVTPALGRDECIERHAVGYLRLYAVGRPNAVTRDVVLDYVNRMLPSTFDRSDDATLRRVCANSEAGVLSCEGGYFLPAPAPVGGKDELADFERYILAKAKGLFRRIALVRKAHPDLGPFRFQLPLFDEEEGEASDD